MTTIRQDTRLKLRDRGANSGLRSGTEEVSPESLTEVAKAATAAEQAAGQANGLSPDLGAAVRAATPPRGPQGSTRTTDATGARPETGGRPGPERGDRGTGSR